MKTYKIVFISLLFLFSELLSAQIYDTIPAIGVECLNKELIEDLMFVFENDSIYISGQIQMNCWENNLLIREIHNDSIFLIATDTCAANCLCMFGFETSIPDFGYDTVYLSLGYLCWLNEYHYQHYLDTVIYRDIVSVFKRDKQDVLYIYPNPIHESLRLNIISSEEAIKSISLYQMSGRLIIKEEYQDDNPIKILHMSEFSSGIYFVKVERSTGTILRKIVKI